MVASYLDQCTGCTAAVAAQTNHPDKHIQNTSLTLFHARSIPTIDLYSYLHRILKYCPCQNEVFISLVIYFRQIIEKCHRKGIAFNIDAYSAHRLIIAGVTVASKWFSDVFFTNTRYAKVGGLPVSELNTLEIQFLTLIDFNATISINKLQEVGSSIFHQDCPPLLQIPSYHITLQGIYVPAHCKLMPAPIPSPQSALFSSKFLRTTPQPSANRHRRLSYPGPASISAPAPTADPRWAENVVRPWPTPISTRHPTNDNSSSIANSARTLYDSPNQDHMHSDLNNAVPKTSDSSGPESSSRPITPCQEIGHDSAFPQKRHTLHHGSVHTETNRVATASQTYF